MTLISRSSIVAGVAAVGITAVAVPLAVAPPPARAATAQYTVDVKPTAAADLFDEWRDTFWPSAGSPPPSPPPTVPVPTPTSLAGSLESLYHAVEPWVRYGFQLAEYAVGWVPYVGWLAPQVMIFYRFGERIVHAIAHNTLDWLDGDGSLLTNIAEGVAWTVDAFIQLGIEEWNFFLPPLPPLPPWPFAQDFAAGYNVVRTSVRDFLQDLSDSVLSGVDEQPEEAPAATEESSIEAEVEPIPDPLLAGDPVPGITPPVGSATEPPEPPAEEQRKAGSVLTGLVTTDDADIRETLDGAGHESDEEQDGVLELESPSALEPSPSGTVETPSGDDNESAIEEEGESAASHEEGENVTDANDPAPKPDTKQNETTADDS